MRFLMACLGLAAAVISSPAQETIADVFADRALDFTRPADRAKAVQRIKAVEVANRDRAHARARAMGKPTRWVLPNGTVNEIVGLDENDEFLIYTTHNANAAISSAANLVYPTPYNLDGTGITVGVWDEAAARASHVEFQTGSGSRVTVRDGTTALSSHATHVAGTVAAKGASSTRKGMAPNALVDSYDWNSDTSEMVAAGATSPQQAGKINISNHSYGYPRGWDRNSSNVRQWYGTGTDQNAYAIQFGQYNSYARTWDINAFNAPYYLPFKSAGNDNSNNPANGESVVIGSSTVSYNSSIHPPGDGLYRGGYENIGDDANAKNIMTVGAVNDAVSNGIRSPSLGTITDFSSRGPTDDGRIKPDIVANGAGLSSTSDSGDTAYTSMSGTSMSSPSAAGSAALLVQLYRNLFPGGDMRASTLKSLILHTATDIGNPGPDYHYGWGLMDTKTAADLIVDHHANPAKNRMVEDQLTTSVTSKSYLFAWDGVSPIRATICWTDPAAASTTAHDSRTPRLVNDLDLKIIAPNGTQYYPFVMPFVGTWTVASMSQHATTGINSTDNVEQVLIQNPGQSGTWQVVIDHKGNLTNNQQHYSLITSGFLSNAETTPFVLSQVPGASSQIPGPISEISLTFNKPMNPASFSVANGIISLNGPAGDLKPAISSHSWSAENTTLTLAFPAQSAFGPYTLVLASQIQSEDGEFLDQNRNEIPGEIIEDQYIGTFEILPPPIYYAGMDTNPGWTLDIGWAFGPPSGTNQDNIGLPGPTAGFNGPNVLGYRLDGDYEPNIAATRWATTPAIDCSSRENISLSFRRWLGVERSQYDRAFLQVSNNGTAWTTVWENPNEDVDDSGWVNVEYDISAVADGQPTIFVRWGLGPTDSSWQYCGWNLDEVLIDGDVLASPDPEIAIARSGIPIYLGGTDGVGGTSVGFATQVSYSITNFGGAELALTTPVNAAAVSNCTIAVTTQPSGTVAPSASTDLVLTITPSSAGAWSATVSIANNDAEKTPFTWTINGNALDSYVVAYDDNISDSGTAPVDVGSPYLEGSTVTVLGNTGNLTKSGFTFAGWSTQANGSGTTYQPGATFSMPGASVTLYAKWNAAPAVDAGPNQTVFMTESVPWTPAMLTTAAWYDSSDASTITKDGSNRVSQWSDKSGNNRHATQGTDASKPLSGTRTLNGLNALAFSGASTQWLRSTANIGSQPLTAIAVAQFDSTAKELTVFDGASSQRCLLRRRNTDVLGLYAGSWMSGASTGAEAVVASVVFNGASSSIRKNGGAAATGNPSTGNLTSGVTIGNNASPGTDFRMDGLIGELVFVSGTISDSDRQKVEGYLAHKWGLAANLPAEHPYKNAAPGSPTAVATLDGTVSDPESDTVTTTWTKFAGPPAAVEFANASAVDTTATFFAEGIYTLRLAANDGRQVSSDDVVITVESNVVVPTYTVSYNGNGQTGGSAPSPQTKTQDVALTLSGPGTLVRNGYTFAGWNTAANGTGNPYAADATYTANADATLFAQWTPNSYTVAFDANGGNAASPATKQVTFDATYGTLASTSRTGYTLAGWFTAASGGTQITASTVVATAANHTLYAQWTANTCTVTFNANGGSAPSPANKQVTFDASYGTLATTTRSGHTFTGWFTAASGGTHVTSSTTVSNAADHTLYAQWNAAPVVHAGPDQTVYISNSIPWTPATITTAAWFDAADASSITTSSGAVSQWNDKSGNGNHASQAAEANRPTIGTVSIGGKNTVSFRLDNQQALTAADHASLRLDASGGANIFAVMKFGNYVNQGSGLNVALSKGQLLSTSTSYGIRVANNTLAYQAGAPNGQLNGSATDGRVLLLSGVRRDSEKTAELYFDGALTTARTNTDPIVSNNSDPLHIGRDSTTSRYANADFGEILIIPGELSTADRQKIEGYLAHKWGLAAELPAEHPCKPTAPSNSNAIAILDGAATDADNDPLTTTWTLIEGPAAVVFADPSDPQTTAAFTVPGTYTLRLTASDGFHSAFDECMVTALRPVDHFAIIGIPSQVTVGTETTGITITALDANNETTTYFNGTVEFGGTAGITGTSASFVDGVLSGVSIRPMLAGTDLTFTVDDGAGHIGTAVFTVQSLFDGWVAEGTGFSNPLTDPAPDSDPDGDGLTNLQEFAFGTDPTAGRPGPVQIDPDGKVVSPGLPDIVNFADPAAAPEFRAVFPRRKDYVMSGLIYTVEFSADLTRWTASAAGLQVLSDQSAGDVDAVSVPFPPSVPVTGDGPEQPPKFFRVAVSSGP